MKIEIRTVCRNNLRLATVVLRAGSVMAKVRVALVIPKQAR